MRISPSHILIHSEFHQKRENCSEENSHFGQHASRLDLDGGTCETGETCRTNDCLNLAGGIGEKSAMLNSANCSNLLSYMSHLSHTSQGCEAHQILTTPNSPASNSSLFWHAETSSNTLVLTWRNALLNRRADSPVNIQAELFPADEMRITHDLSGEIATE